MATKTAAGLVAYSKAQLGMPYWYGTYGNRPTLEKLLEKAKQYPSQLTPDRVAYAKSNHVGKFPRTYDCIGLVKGYLWSDSPTAVPKYNGTQDTSAGGMRSKCKSSSKMADMPDVPGVLVFRGTAHVGVYIGSGKVIEAKGFNYGVVETALKSGSWDGWGKCPWIEYGAAAQPVAAPASAPKEVSASTTLKAGDRVRIKNAGIPYYPGAIKIPVWVGKETHTVDSNPMERNGKKCVRLKEIKTWCDVENLEKTR
jgi:hypothetical protein